MTVIKQGEKIARQKGWVKNRRERAKPARAVKGPSARPARTGRPARRGALRRRSFRPSLTAMSRARRVAIVVGLLGAAVIAAVMAPPIPQDPAYHRLADARRVLRDSERAQRAVQLPFVLVGALGAWAVRPGAGERPASSTGASDGRGWSSSRVFC